MANKHVKRFLMPLVVIKEMESKGRAYSTAARKDKVKDQQQQYANEQPEQELSYAVDGGVHWHN